MDVCESLRNGDIESIVKGSTQEPKSLASVEFAAKPMLDAWESRHRFFTFSKPSVNGAISIQRNVSATVMLPVYHTGSFLFIGDAPALQGDGAAAFQLALKLP